MATSWEGGDPYRIPEEKLVRIEMEKEEMLSIKARMEMEHRRTKKAAYAKHMGGEPEPMSSIERMRRDLERANKAAAEAQAAIDRYNEALAPTSVLVQEGTLLPPQMNYCNSWSRLWGEDKFNQYGEPIIAGTAGMYRGRSVLWSVTNPTAHVWYGYCNNTKVQTFNNEEAAIKYMTRLSQSMLDWDQDQVDLYLGKTDPPKVIPEEYGEW